MIKLTTPERGIDDFGSGAFGASRGSRTHNGIDYCAQPNSLVYPVSAGTVTKLGYPYSDNLNFRYVQVTDDNGYDWRYFYVKPTVDVGDIVTRDDVIGWVQNLDVRYKGITPHIHLEVKNPDGTFVNPKVVRNV